MDEEFTFTPNILKKEDASDCVSPKIEELGLGILTQTLTQNTQNLTQYTQEIWVSKNF